MVAICPGGGGVHTNMSEPNDTTQSEYISSYDWDGTPFKHINMLMKWKHITTDAMLMTHSLTRQGENKAPKITDA